MSLKPCGSSVGGIRVEIQHGRQFYKRFCYILKTDATQQMWAQGCRMQHDASLHTLAVVELKQLYFVHFRELTTYENGVCFTGSANNIQSLPWGF